MATTWPIVLSDGSPTKQSRMSQRLTENLVVDYDVIDGSKFFRVMDLPVPLVCFQMVLRFGLPTVMVQYKNCKVRVIAGMLTDANVPPVVLLLILLHVVLLVSKLMTKKVEKFVLLHHLTIHLIQPM